MSTVEPLAYRLRPQTLDQFYGQEHILGKGKLLRRMIEADRITSIILYGPPGTGKTTLARIIANCTNATFERLNAVTSGVADIKRICSQTSNDFLNPSGKTVLFIDEIHRFNKAQQDALLPSVENGSIVLIGATTENPYFEVNKALISRSSVFMLKALDDSAIAKILQRAITDKEYGLGNYNIKVDDEALNHWVTISGGDARRALNALELAVLTTKPYESGLIHIDFATAVESCQSGAVRFDKDGEEHYDNISAFIKSMRGSNPDAAVFYLARALYAGEDPVFLARRIMICASEDVGLANNQALQIAVAASEAVHRIGMPEARIILAQAAIAVAVSPKSNSAYMAINSALADIEKGKSGTIPMHLRNAPVKGMEDQGYGKGYKYAHDYPGHFVKMDFLPEELKGTKYYEPSDNGSEKRVKEWLDSWRD
ncbi:MAG: replication-associated recombination protein A [Clostridia bacterium]|nr:replication-associated recombination protein A [Clostridia bacterium]